MERRSPHERKAPTAEELLTQWSPLIRKLGMKNGVKPEDLEDFVSDVVTEYLAGDYAEKYDPELGAFTTFLFAFISRRAWRDRDKRTRKDRRQVTQALVDEPEEDENGNLSMSVPVDPNDYFAELEEGWTFEDILAPLRSKPVLERIHHVVELDGVLFDFSIDRSLYSLVVLLLLQFNQREIAMIYRRSVGTVSAMMAELRSEPSVIRAVLRLRE